MSTKRVDTLAIPSGGEKSLPANRFRPPKGKLVKAMILRMTLPVKNATAGAINPLTTQQRKDLLNCFRISVSYGKDLKRKPYIALLGNRFRLEAKDAYNSEIDGWSEATGFVQNFANGATTNAIVELPIPLGKRQHIPAHEQHLWGMGRSQARTMEIVIKRETDLTGTANLTLDPAQDVTVELYPDYASCKGDVWGLVPEYREKDEVADEVTLANDGLPLRVSERTAAHAACALTNFNVRIDDEVIYEGIRASVIARELRDDSGLLSGGDISDEETIIYKPKYGESMRFLQTGRVTFRQNQKDLATAKLAILYVPYLDESTIKAEVQDIADKIREKPVRAANAHLMAGLDLPKRTAGLPFWHFWDKDDREFESAPGWVATPAQTEPVLTVPESVLAVAKAKEGAHKANGETKAASDVEKQLATLVPGAITGGRGTRTGFSALINRISRMFG